MLKNVKVTYYIIGLSSVCTKVFMYNTHVQCTLLYIICIRYTVCICMRDVSVISSDPPCKDDNARFTTVPWKP